MSQRTAFPCRYTQSSPYNFDSTYSTLRRLITCIFHEMVLCQYSTNGQHKTHRSIRRLGYNIQWHKHLNDTRMYFWSKCLKLPILKMETLCYILLNDEILMMPSLFVGRRSILPWLSRLHPRKYGTSKKVGYVIRETLESEKVFTFDHVTCWDVSWIKKNHPLSHQ